MKYLIMHTTDGTAMTPEAMAGVGRFMEEQARAGTLLAAEGIDPSADGARVTFRDGKRTAIDAPFTEAKEVVGGFAVVQAGSLDEAVELASRFGAVCTHATEIRVLQLLDFSAP
jgi:hypothetical protein